MRAPLDVLLLLFFCYFAYSSSLHLGKVDVDSLKETEICYEGKACLFRGNMTLDNKDKADTVRNRVKKEQENFDLLVAFTVESHCSTNETLFYKLKVTDYRRNSHPTVGEANSKLIQQHPCFFKQRRSDGTITEIIFGAKDPKFSRNIKQGIIHTLSKRIHPAALQKASDASSSSSSPVSYIFEGTDIGGKFKASHKLHKLDSGDVMLMETKEYEDNLSESTATTKGVDIKGQKMDVDRKSVSNTVIGENGRVRDVGEEASVNVGSDRPPKEEPLYPTPSTGKSSFGNNFKIERVETREAPASKCNKNSTTDAQVVQFIDMILEGSVPRAFRKPLTINELQEDIPHEQSEGMLHDAKALLRQGDFKVNDMVPLLTKDNVGEIAAFARKLYADDRLTIKTMKTLLGCLSAIRSTSTYKELLGAMYAKEAHYDVRQQALVSMIHTRDEPHPPEYVIDMVTKLSQDDSDPFSQDATMLLGALLERHPNAHMATMFVQTSSNELSLLDPNSSNTALRALVLIGALRNMGDRAYPALAVIERFASSRVWNVHNTAEEAVKYVRERHNEEAGQHGNHEENVKTRDGNNNGDDDDDVRRKLKHLKVKLPKKDEEWLNEQVYLDQGDAGIDHFNADNLNQEDKGRTEGGRLAEIKIPLTGNSNFGVNVVMYSGAEWDANQATAMGNIEMEVKVLFFKMKVLNVGASYLLKKGVEMKVDNFAKLTEGAESALTFTVVGKVVLQQKKPAPDSSVVIGGSCPNKLENARGAMLPKREWYLPLFIFKQLFPLGPFPVTLTVIVGGNMGYEQYGATYANCQYHQKGKNVGIVGGFGPSAGIDVKMIAELNFGIASAGIEGTLLILKATLPIYGIANTQTACGHIELKLQALDGKIVGFVKVMGKRIINIPILKWNGPKKTINLMNQCKNVQDGHFPQLSFEKDQLEEKAAEDKAGETAQSANTEREKAAAMEQKERDEDRRRYHVRSKGPAGPAELNHMRRSYEKMYGFPVDKKYEDAKVGWPWNDMKKKTTTKKNKNNNNNNNPKLPRMPVDEDNNSSGNKGGNDDEFNVAKKAAQYEKRQSRKNKSAYLIAKAMKKGRHFHHVRAADLGPFSSSRAAPESFEAQQAAANAVDKFANEIAKSVGQQMGLFNETSSEKKKQSEKKAHDNDNDKDNDKNRDKNNDKNSDKNNDGDHDNDKENHTNTHKIKFSSNADPDATTGIPHQFQMRAADETSGHWVIKDPKK